MARRIITPRGRQARIEGLTELTAKIEEILNRTTGREVKRVFLRGAIILRDQARVNAPVYAGDDKRAHPGQLRDAIFAAAGDPKEPNALVGVNYKRAYYAHMVEFGTAKMAARPFLRPAIRQARNAVVSMVADGLRELLTK